MSVLLQLRQDAFSVTCVGKYFHLSPLNLSYLPLGWCDRGQWTLACLCMQGEVCVGRGCVFVVDTFLNVWWYCLYYCCHCGWECDRTGISLIGLWYSCTHDFIFMKNLYLTMSDIFISLSLFLSVCCLSQSSGEWKWHHCAWGLSWREEVHGELNVPWCKHR